ncbi:MAG: TonB C-terminal domain-containing protein [Campylobacteraceae bacterium]|jgi:protein TonB|nr:TonB C-terminal domain-containing protein [Campylobacteraceae bacterium]
MVIIEKRYYLTGFYISLVLYASIFCVLTYFVSKSDIFIQRFTSKKDVLDIMLVEAPKDKITISVSSTLATSKKESTSSPASTKTQTAGVQDLFKTIDETKLTQTGAKQSTPSRLDGKDTPQENASKILDKLEFKQQRTLIVTGASSGIYDPFIGKIQDMLYERWQNTIYTSSGAKAEVEVKIDKIGKFSYSIVTLSYNTDFNLKLKNFLDDMRQEQFPPYEGDGDFNMKTIFKDLME